MGEYDCLYLHACNFKNRPFKRCVGNFVFCRCRRRPMLLLCIQCFVIYDLLRFIYIFVFVLPITLDLFFPAAADNFVIFQSLPHACLLSDVLRCVCCCRLRRRIFYSLSLFVHRRHRRRDFPLPSLPGMVVHPCGPLFFYKVDHVAISSQTQCNNKIKKETTNTKYNQVSYKDNVKLCTLEK